MTEEITIFFQIIFIDLILAGDNAIIIGMVASKFPPEQRKKIIFLGHWRSSNIKNFINSHNSISFTDYRFKINWRSVASLHSL